MNAEQARAVHTVLHALEVAGTTVTIFQPHLGGPILVAVETAKVYLDLQERKDATENESQNVTPQTSETINPPGTEVKFEPVTAVETPPEPKNIPGMGM